MRRFIFGLEPIKAPAFRARRSQNSLRIFRVIPDRVTVTPITHAPFVQDPFVQAGLAEAAQQSDWTELPSPV